VTFQLQQSLAHRAPALALEVPQETDPSFRTPRQIVCENQGSLAGQWHICVDGNFLFVPRHRCIYRAQAPCPWPQDVPWFLSQGDSTASATVYIASVNTSASQLSHVQPMTVQDVYALVTLMSLYLSEASGHQKAYKELLAHIDDGHALTLDKVQYEIIRFSRSRAPRSFSLTHAGDSPVCNH
jgi:hypothetical protein